MLVVFRLAPTASILPLCEAFHCGKFCINNGLREIRSLRATCCRVHLLHKIVDTCCWLYHPPHYVAIEIYPKYLRYIFMYIHMYIYMYTLSITAVECLSWLLWIHFIWFLSSNYVFVVVALLIAIIFSFIHFFMSIEVAVQKTCCANWRILQSTLSWLYKKIKTGKYLCFYFNRPPIAFDSHKS